jgi:hypothetical protein
MILNPPGKAPIIPLRAFVRTRGQKFNISPSWEAYPDIVLPGFAGIGTTKKTFLDSFCMPVIRRMAFKVTFI